MPTLTPFDELYEAYRDNFCQLANITPAVLESCEPPTAEEAARSFMELSQTKSPNEAWAFLNLWQEHLAHLASPSFALNGTPYREIIRLLDQFPLQCGTDPIENSRNVGMVLSFLLKRSMQEHPQLRCFLLDYKDFNQYIETLTEPGRYQVIVENENHYTAVDIRVSHNGDKESIVLDAAVNVKMSPALAILGNHCTSIYNAFTMRQIQHDTHSCPLFALDHVIQIAQLHDIYELCARSSWPSENGQASRGQHYQVDSFALPPPLVWNAQSANRFMAPYCKNQIDKGISETSLEELKAYLTRGVRKDPGSERPDVTRGGYINDSILINVRDYHSVKALSLLIPLHYKQCLEQHSMEQTVNAEREAEDPPDMGNRHGPNLN